MTRPALAAMEAAHRDLVHRLLQAPSPALQAEEAASAGRLIDARRRFWAERLDA